MYSSSSMNVDKFNIGATRLLNIRNLNQNTTDDGLKTTFEIFGEIIKIHINTAHGTTEKCGLIEYADILSVEKAILTMDGEILEGNCINLSFGEPVATTCVWIDGISERVSEKYLKLYFGNFGFVTNSEIDRSRQQALVFFHTLTEAQSAISHLHGAIFKGNRLQLDFASIHCQQVFYEHLDKTFCELKSHQLVTNSLNDDTIHNSKNSMAVDFDKNSCDKSSNTLFNSDTFASKTNCIYSLEENNNDVPVKFENSSISCGEINDCSSQTKQAEKHTRESSKVPQLNKSNKLEYSKYDQDHLLSPLDSVSNDLQSSDDSQLCNDEIPLDERLKRFNEMYEQWDQSKKKVKNFISNTQSQTKYKHFDIINIIKPSSILQNIFSKPSVFMDDAKRLENVSDSYITCESMSFQRNVENLVLPPPLVPSSNSSLKHHSASFLSTNKTNNCSFPSRPLSTKTSQHYMASKTGSRLPTNDIKLAIEPMLIAADLRLPPHLRKPFFSWTDANCAINRDKHYQPKKIVNKNEPEKNYKNGECFTKPWIVDSFSNQTHSGFRKEELNYNKNEQIERILKDIFQVKEDSKETIVNSRCLAEVQEKQNNIISQILKEHIKYNEKKIHQAVPDIDEKLKDDTKPISYKPSVENAIRSKVFPEQSIKRKMCYSAENLKSHKILKMDDKTLECKNSCKNYDGQKQTFLQKNMKRNRNVTPSKTKFKDDNQKIQDKNKNQLTTDIPTYVSMYDKVKARSARKSLLVQEKKNDKNKNSVCVKQKKRGGSTLK